MSKPECTRKSGISPREKSANCLDGIRHGGDVTFIWALVRNLGTCSLDVKGEIESGGPTKMRVPKQDTGTEQPVVVMKSAKADGTKGLRYPLCMVVNQLNWEEPVDKAKLPNGGAHETI